MFGTFANHAINDKNEHDGKDYTFNYLSIMVIIWRLPGPVHE